MLYPFPGTGHETTWFACVPARAGFTSRPRYVNFGFAGGSVIEPMLTVKYPCETVHCPLEKVKVVPPALAFARAGPQKVRTVAPATVCTPAVHEADRVPA